MKRDKTSDKEIEVIRDIDNTIANLMQLKGQIKNEKVLKYDRNKTYQRASACMTDVHHSLLAFNRTNS